MLFAAFTSTRTPAERSRALLGTARRAFAAKRDHSRRQLLDLARPRGALPGSRERPKARERGHQGAGPGPALGKVQPDRPPRAGDPPGHVQEAVAKALGLGAREISLEKKRLGPAHKVLGDQHQLQPSGVRGELAKGQVAKAGVLGGPDRILHPCPGPVAGLQNHRIAVLVCEHHLEAVAIGIREGELGARVRALTPTDRPRACRPPRQVEVAKLSHPGPLTLGEVLSNRRCPCRLGHREDRLPRVLVDAHAGREGALHLEDSIEELVGAAGRVGTHEDRDVGVLAHRLRKLVERVHQHLGVVGAGANTAADHTQVLVDALDQLPEAVREDTNIPILVRTDSAGCTHEFLDAVLEMECSFSASMRIDEHARQTILAVAESAWTPAIRQDLTEREGAWVAELCDLDLSGWPAGARAICRRERPHPGAQLTFSDADGHRFQVMLTNQHGDPVALEARHRARARVEDAIRAAKDTGLRNLPFREFTANAAWLELVLIAQDLVSWAQSLLLEGDLARAEPKRLRYRLLHVAGRITRSGRRTRLHLPEGWPWAGALVDAFSRLRALPAPG